MSDIKEIFYEKDTYQHKHWVSQKLMFCAGELLRRASIHDDSKFTDEEKPFYVEPVFLLNHESSIVYGSDEYKKLVNKMGQGWAHHSETNDHHPEFFENDISRMNLFQLLEMVCDWFAAAKRKGNHPAEALKFIKAKLPPELESILRNTIEAIKP